MTFDTTGPTRLSTLSRRKALASAGAGVLFSALPFGTRRYAAAQTGGPAETIFRGGPIVTVDEARPTAEAVAVAAGRILAVGTEAEVMAHCNAHMAGFKAPKRVEFVQTLPKNPSGKLLKRELRAQYA
jgi:hypothetical protein